MIDNHKDVDQTVKTETKTTAEIETTTNAGEPDVQAQHMTMVATILNTIETTMTLTDQTETGIKDQLDISHHELIAALTPTNTFERTEVDEVTENTIVRTEMVVTILIGQMMKSRL